MPSKRNDRRLIAWETHEQTDTPIEPATIDRDWMDASNGRYAYRCLPMVLANQAGWIVRNPVALRLRWNGGPLATDLRIRLPPGSTDRRHYRHRQFRHHRCRRRPCRRRRCRPLSKANGRKKSTPASVEA